MLIFYLVTAFVFCLNVDAEDVKNEPDIKSELEADVVKRVDSAGLRINEISVHSAPELKESKEVPIEVLTDHQFVNLNPETAFGPEIITSFEFENISLVELTQHMQKLTGLNLIIDKDIKGKISIMAPSAITVGDAWRAFLTALNTNGYTLVKSGNFFKIVEAKDIRYTPTKIYTGHYTPDTENYVMRIIPLKNINSTEVTRSFRPFMTRYGESLILSKPIQLLFRIQVKIYNVYLS